MEEFLYLLKRRRALRIPPLHRMKPDSIIVRFGVDEDDYFDLSTEDDKWELIDGKLIIHTPASPRHVRINDFLDRLLALYVSYKGSGEVFHDPATLRLQSGKNVQPDVFFLSKRTKKQENELYIEAVADFVIEVTSKYRRRYDLGEKLKVYQQSGVREIWVVDRDKQHVHRFLKRGEQYQEEIWREGRLKSKVVRGFWVDISWLWQEPLPNALWAFQQILGGAR